MARHYGAVSDLDTQGRVLVPQVLRRKLSIEDQQVWLGYDNGVIEIYGEAMYQRRLAEAEDGIGAAADLMKQQGVR